jgi:hypothetical protein
MISVPTASQSEALGHDTPLKVASVTDVGRFSSFHVEPFQDSAYGSVEKLSLMYSPTAWQDAASRHETAVRPAPPFPRGLGATWSFQAVPFQDSARLTSVPASSPKGVLLKVEPTASQAVSAEQDTAASAPFGTNGTGTDLVAHPPLSVAVAGNGETLL